MNKLIVTGILLLGGISTASAQYTFAFEDATVPAEWVAEQGKLTVNTAHYTEGKQSLAWEVPAGEKASVLVNFTSFKTGSYAAFFNLYSYNATNSALTVEFLNAEKEAQHTANVTMNFSGWREFNRVYGKDFKSKLAKTLAYVRLTLDNTGQKAAQTLLFDDVKWKASADNKRQAQDLMVKDVKVIEEGHKTLLTLYAYEPDIDLSEPTAAEREGIAAIKASYPYQPQGVTNPRELVNYRTRIKALNIVRHTDGTVQGSPVIGSISEVSMDGMNKLLLMLNGIAASTKEEDSKLFADFFDLVVDQGVMYRFDRLPSNNYTVVRDYPKLLLNLLPKCNEKQSVELLKMVRWVTEAGWAYADLAYLSTEFSSDVIYNYLSHFLSYAAYQPDAQVAVRELKSMSRFLERVLTPVPGGYDTVKPDGLGFHHGTHYNNYMYAYNGWMDAAYNLKATPFRVSKTACDYIKKAVLTCYQMANRSNTGSNYYANSLSGRHPLDGGHVVQFSKAYFEKLIEVSTDVLGSQDSELASAYNYFLMSDKYDAPQADYAGFYQFNYSPIGVYRHADWVVTMRSPTTRMWGAEIYNKTSRFSRYQSHGTMEVLYNGGLAESGLPTGPVGYDWNVAPGGTTVHYTSWKEMMPKGNLTQRFDQFTKTKDFAGALSFGDCGMFACDFDQVDTWGGQCFTPTNLVFKKSVYAFDGMLIDLGSGISSSGSYGDDRITATNLFQEVGSDMGILTVNGSAMAAGDAEKNLTAGEARWLVTPKGTGYYVPQGNDAVVVKYGEQEGPNEDGSDVDNPAKAIATKAYINHGVKPSDKSYTFVMVPKTTPDAMKSLAEEMGKDGGKYFSILSQTDKFHALTYKPKNITAYVFFEAVDDTKLPGVKSVGSEMLLMYQPNDNGSIHLAVCNPNLRPQAVSSALGDWLSGETVTSITLEGEWYTDQVAEGLKVNAPANGQTIIELTLNHGLPIHIYMGPKGFTSVDTNSAEEDWVHIAQTGKNVYVTLTEEATVATQIELFSAEGMKLSEMNLPAGERSASIRLLDDKAVQVLRVVNGEKVNIVKCIG